MVTQSKPSGFAPDASFADAAERFFELLKSMGTASAPGAAAATDWSTLAGPLAGQFEQWLRNSQSSNPWLGGMSVPGGAAGFGTTPFWPQGASLPLGLGAAPQADSQRSLELVGRLAQLQAQLATHWSEIAASASRSFVARLGAMGSAGALSMRAASTPADALKLYELWVECAEEAYAARVHRDDFCRLQADLANASAALLVEQRRHAETLARAFGLPTRNEVDALYAHIKDLRRQLAQLETQKNPGVNRTNTPRAAADRPPPAAGKTAHARGKPGRKPRTSRKRRV